MQRQIEKESAVDVNNSVEMQNACQALQDHRDQLAEKSNQIDTYAQVRNIRYPTLHLDSENSAVSHNGYDLKFYLGSVQSSRITRMNIISCVDFRSYKFFMQHPNI